LRVLFGHHQPSASGSGVQSKPCTLFQGGDVFDLQIVATMQANDVQRIYAFNVEDFEVFPELAVVKP
jgi:hypothetical protein